MVSSAQRASDAPSSVPPRRSISASILTCVAAIGLASSARNASAPLRRTNSSGSLPSGMRSADAATPYAVSVSIDLSAASTPAASASKHSTARDATLRSSRA